MLNVNALHGTIRCFGSEHCTVGPAAHTRARSGLRGVQCHAGTPEKSDLVSQFSHKQAAMYLCNGKCARVIKHEATTHLSGKQMYINSTDSFDLKKKRPDTSFGEILHVQSLLHLKQFFRRELPFCLLHEHRRRWSGSDAFTTTGENVQARGGALVERAGGRT